MERRRGRRPCCAETARAIADGKVVGWFQGRMEWGPRALGNRSILCDPRRADMKELLNRKIKRRESFRPFAPSILREQRAEWFDDGRRRALHGEGVQGPPENRREQIPAVTHVDGTGRLQTVERSTAPRYHDLISRFEEITGVPVRSQHLVQRERADRPHAGRGDRLLPAHRYGPADPRSAAHQQEAQRRLPSPSSPPAIVGGAGVDRSSRSRASAGIGARTAGRGDERGVARYDGRRQLAERDDRGV